MVNSGAAAGTTFPARDGLTLGRHPLNAVCLRDPGILAYHAVLKQVSGAWILQDLTGTGLIVGGQRADHIDLEAGATVHLGPVEVCWHVGGTPPAIQHVLHSRTITTDLPSPAIAGTGFEAPTELTTDRLESVLSLEATIAEELDYETLVKHLADWMDAAVPAHHSAVLLKGPDGELHTHSQRSSGHAPVVEPSSSIIRQAVTRRVGVLISNAPEDDRVRHGQSIVIQNIRAALCVPLVARGQVIGALYAATMGIAAAFDESHLRMLSLIAGPMASALHSATLVRRLSDTNHDLLRRLSTCAQFNDDDTGFHIQRVGDYAAALAAAVGQTPEVCELIRTAAPMHDIGKIGIPQAILQKPGKLTSEEWVVMQTHAELGERILGGSTAPLIQLAAELAGSHHEKWDGSGYPRGIVGGNIPLSGRLVAVADVFDALTTERCYKPAFPLEKAYAILREGSGKHFDPQIVQAFFHILDEVLAIRDRYAALEHPDSPA